MKTGAWHIHCFDIPTDIDIQDSLMVDGFMAMPVIIAMCTYIYLQQNSMMKKITLLQGTQS